MNAHHTTEIEIESERSPEARRDGRGRYEYRLYTVDARVEVNEEFCELRSVIGLSRQGESGEEIPLGIDELPAAGLASLRSCFADDDTRREIFEKACAIEADEDADLNRRIRNEERSCGW
jgi:hypothetical protein